MDTAIKILPRNFRTIFTNPQAKTAGENASFDGVLVLFFMLAAAAAGWFLLLKQSLRLDEAQSLWQTDRSLSGMFHLVAQDVHVPLYHVLLHFWQQLFGNQVEGARLFSLIFFLASIPAVYVLGKMSLGRPAGLFASLLAAFSPFLNWYGNEIRMYSLFVFLAVLNHYAFLRLFEAIEAGKRESTVSTVWIWAGYGITLLLGVYTHYFFWLILFSQAMFFLLYRSSFPKGALLKFAAIATGVFISVLPWVYWVWRMGSAGNSQPLLFKPGTLDLFNALYAYFFGYHGTAANSLVLASWPVLVLLLFFGLQKNKSIPKPAIYFLLASVMPLLLAFALSFVRPVFSARYLIFVAPTLYLFISWLFSTYEGKLEWVLKSVLVVAMAAMVVSQGVGSQVPVREDFRLASSLISKQATSRDIVAVSAPFTVYPFEYYYRGPARVATIPAWDRLARGPIPKFSQAELVEETNNFKSLYSRIWLVTSYDQGYEKEIHNYFETHFHREFEREVSPGLTVYAYRLRYDGLSHEY